MWTVAFGFMLHQPTRAMGVMLALPGLPVAWVRIHLDIHCPIDMAGSVAVAPLVARLGTRSRRWFVPRLFALAPTRYRPLFARMIRRGWFR